MIYKLYDFYKKIFWGSEKYARSIGVKIGENCAIASKNFGSEPYLISIGDHVQITNDVKFVTHGGGWVFRLKNPKFDFFGRIKIGNNVYIGNNAIILPGVTVGNNVIIGGAAVVSKSIEDNQIVVGNPGRVVGNVNDLEDKMAQYNLNTKGLSSSKKKQILLSADSSQFIKK